jgi:hypothetical protein
VVKSCSSSKKPLLLWHQAQLIHMLGLWHGRSSNGSAACCCSSARFYLEPVFHWQKRFYNLRPGMLALFFSSSDQHLETVVADN